MDRLKASRMGYMPTPASLVAAKPAGVIKEPVYTGTPRYGILRFGNGPKSDTLVALDITKDGSRLYIDSNQNGDLSDDGTGEWDVVREISGANVEFATRPVHVSWGNLAEEGEGGEYRIFIFRRPETNGFSYATISGREGKAEFGETPEADGKDYAKLVTSAADVGDLKKDIVKELPSLRSVDADRIRLQLAVKDAGGTDKLAALDSMDTIDEALTKALGGAIKPTDKLRIIVDVVARPLAASADGADTDAVQRTRVRSCAVLLCRCPPPQRAFAALPPTWFTTSSVLIARPAPLAMSSTMPA
jgi:hypothetical protein